MTASQQQPTTTRPTRRVPAEAKIVATVAFLILLLVRATVGGAALWLAVRQLGDHWPVAPLPYPACFLVTLGLSVFLTAAAPITFRKAKESP